MHILFGAVNIQLNLKFQHVRDPLVLSLGVVPCHHALGCRAALSDLLQMQSNAPALWNPFLVREFCQVLFGFHSCS